MWIGTARDASFGSDLSRKAVMTQSTTAASRHDTSHSATSDRFECHGLRSLVVDVYANVNEDSTRATTYDRFATPRIDHPR